MANLKIALLTFVGFIITACSGQHHQSPNSTVAAPEVNAGSGDNSPKASGQPSNLLTGRKPIRCQKSAPTSATGNAAMFTASDCTGGQLPDLHYLGALTHLEVPGGTNGKFTVGQPLIGGGLHTTFFPLASSSSNYTAKVTYLEADTATTIDCDRTLQATAGANQVTFTANDCGGTLPSGNYVAIPAAILVAGGTNGEFLVGQPVIGEAPTVKFTATAGGNSEIQVLYVKVQPGSAMVCGTSGALSSSGVHSHTFLGSECGGSRPADNTVAIPSVINSNGGIANGFAIGQPSFGEAASVQWWSTGATGNYSLSVVYVNE